MVHHSPDAATSTRLRGMPTKLPDFFALVDPSTAHPVTDPTLLGNVPKIDRASAADQIDRFKRAGIDAQRIASPGLIEQLVQSLKRPVDTLILSLLDTDPAIPLNGIVAAHYGLELVACATALAQISGATSIQVPFDLRVPSEWLRTIAHHARSRQIRLVGLANDYPQHDTTLLLYTLKNRRLRPGRLPTEQGVVLLDASTAMLIGQLLLRDRAPALVPVAVREHVRRRSSFILSPPDWTAAQVLARCEIDRDRVNSLRAGDLLRQIDWSPTQLVGTGENVIHILPAEQKVNPDPCIRCAWCFEACPTRIQPAGILDAAQLNDLERAEAAGLNSCIECGVCSYVCPSRLPILPAIRQMKRLAAGS